MFLATINGLEFVYISKPEPDAVRNLCSVLYERSKMDRYYDALFMEPVITEIEVQGTADPKDLGVVYRETKRIPGQERKYSWHFVAPYRMRPTENTFRVSKITVIERFDIEDFNN